MSAYFFYGTLLDEEVVQGVLGRTLVSLKPEEARLDGYQRLKVIGASYPAAVEVPGQHIDGIIVRDVSKKEESILAAYEGDEYSCISVSVITADGVQHRAKLFVPGEAIRASDEIWDFDEWVREHKSSFMAEDLPEMTSRS